MSANNGTKKTLTFQQLQAMNGGSLKKSSFLSPKAMLSPKARTPTDKSSPLTERIRQQILQQADQEAQIAPNSSTRTAAQPRVSLDPTARRQRFERNKHRLESMGVSPRLITQSPLITGTIEDELKTPNGAVREEAFFTPSPVPITTTSRSNYLQQLRSTKASATKTPTSVGSKSVILPRNSNQKMSTTTKSSLTPPLVPTTGKAKACTTTTPTFAGTQNRTPLRAVSHNTPPSPASHKNDDENDQISTRRNLDKRSARLRYSGEFSRQIAKYKASPSLSPLPVSAKNSKKCHAKKLSSSVQVYVRKRPIFPHEIERGDFDVVAIDNVDDTAGGNSDAMVVVYSTQMAADMRTKLIQPITFAGVKAAFDSDVDSQKVYDTVVAPLVETVMNDSSTTKAATLLMFGQTGSGKTYSMSACQELVAQQLFSSGQKSSSSSMPSQVQVQSIELAGKHCRDLMSDAVEAKDGAVKILEQEDGSVRFINATSATVASAEELTQLLLNAKERRTTQSTQQNEESSRSHAIYQIRLVRKTPASSRKGSRSSVLTLVDCAGTERRNDSMYHCKDRQAESAEINASLHALKECIRHRGLGSSHVPYRQHLLTRVLRESLESDDAPLAVIATIAPNATDTEHTVETLKTVSTLTNTTLSIGDAQKVEGDVVADAPKAPKQWTHDELMGWMSRKRLLPTKAVVASGMVGSAVMRMSKIQMSHAFYDGDGRQAELLFSMLRAEADRVAKLDLKRRFAQKAFSDGSIRA